MLRFEKSVGLREKFSASFSSISSKNCKKRKERKERTVRKKIIRFENLSIQSTRDFLRSTSGTNGKG